MFWDAVLNGFGLAMDAFLIYAVVWVAWYAGHASVKYNHQKHRGPVEFRFFCLEQYGRCILIVAAVAFLVAAFTYPSLTAPHQSHAIALHTATLYASCVFFVLGIASLYGTGQAVKEAKERHESLLPPAVLILLLSLVVTGCGGGGGASAPNRAAPSPVVFLGDSVTQGSGGVKGFPALVGADLGIVAINRGIGGDTSEKMLNRLPDCLDAQPQTLVLECGLNDMGNFVSPEDFAAHVRAIVDTCHYRKISVILCLVIPYPGRVGTVVNPVYLESLAAYNVSLRQIATEKGCVMADLNTAFLLGGEGLYQVDGEHPTDKGQAIIARTVEAVLH